MVVSLSYFSAEQRSGGDWEIPLPGPGWRLRVAGDTGHTHPRPQGSKATVRRLSQLRRQVCGHWLCCDNDDNGSFTHDGENEWYRNISIVVAVQVVAVIGRVGGGKPAMALCYSDS